MDRNTSPGDSTHPKHDPPEYDAFGEIVRTPGNHSQTSEELLYDTIIQQASSATRYAAMGAQALFDIVGETTLTVASWAEWVWEEGIPLAKLSPKVRRQLLEQMQKDRRSIMHYTPHLRE